MAKEMTWLGAIEKVLKEENSALHYTDIANLIAERNYKPSSVGATPSQTVVSRLGKDLKRKGSKFVRVSRGTYALKTFISTANQADFEDDDFQSVQNSKGIIQCFGIAWDRTHVVWKSSPSLFGEQTVGSTPIDFGEQIGVYLLHDGREVIYVGQAFDQSIGSRLYQHTKDRLKGRWNRFSWFGLHSVDEDGVLHVFSTEDRLINSKMLVNTLEAILIESMEPRQNRRSGNGFFGLEYLQHEDPEIAKSKALQVLSK